MTHEFRTTLNTNQISAYYESKIEGFNTESDEQVYISDMIIVWQIEFELREYGIKSAVASVITLEFTALQEDYTDPDANETLKGFETTFKKDDSWKVEILEDSFMFNSMCIDSCEIDFDKGIIEFS